MEYYKNPKFKRKRLFKTSNTEINHLLRAWAAITFAFAVVISSGLQGFFPNLINAAIIVATAFILHELAHKLVAQHYNLFAEFRAQTNMLWFAIFMSFFGIIFAAPGAVMIQGHASKRQYGIISLAGPMTNLITALIFILISPLGIGNLFLQRLISQGVIINIWIAIFNMIPIVNFDGAKVLRWNKFIYFTSLAAMILLFMMIF